MINAGPLGPWEISLLLLWDKNRPHLSRATREAKKVGKEGAVWRNGEVEAAAGGVGGSVDAYGHK